MAVGNSGGACLMSIPETQLKVDFSKCVPAYQVSSLSDAYSEIPEYFDREEFQRNQEIENKKKIAEEKRIAEEVRKKKIKSDRELPAIITKLDALLKSKDTNAIISTLIELEKTELIDGNESSLNHNRIQKYFDIKFNYESEIKRLEKERVRLENERISLEKERLEKERIRLANEIIEKERVRLENQRLEEDKIEKERILSYTKNTIVIKNLEISNHDFPGEMSWFDASSACSALADGWRLPTTKELKVLRKNREKIGGGFTNRYYWSSTLRPFQGSMWHTFSKGKSYYYDFSKKFNCNVRAVRDVKPS